MQSQFKQEFAALKGMGGVMFGAMDVEVKSVRKIGCKEDGENAYRCDVELEVKQGGQTAKAPTIVRMVKTSSGWAVCR